VAAVAGEAGFDDEDFSTGVFDGSGEWTAKIGWLDLVVVVAAAVGSDLRVEGRDWI